MLIKRILAIINAAAALIIFLVAAIFIPTFSMGFYRAEYAKLGVPERIGVSESDLMDVTRRLTDYMRGRADNLVITVEVNGVSREFFDDREKAHMVDVKDLFTLARVGFAAAACMFIITGLVLRKELRLLARSGLGVMLGFIALLAALAGIISLDFERSWNTFHLIFFSNDLWLLDPATSLLINIVPLEFFMDIVIRVGLIFGGLVLAYTGALFIYLKKFSGR